MPEQVTYSIAVVCEADADRRAACALSDRVLCERVDWVVPETLDYLRRYRGIRDHEPFLLWTRMKAVAQKQRVVAHGFVHGEPRKPDEVMAERALLILAALDPPPSAVVLTRDADKEKQRREGFEQARSARRWPFEVVIGVADSKRECWILAGFEPTNDAERALLDEERKALGFDPRSSAEKLTASEDGAKRDAKRVLKALTNGDRDREDACLAEPPLSLLKERGAMSGLARFLQELEDRLVPLFEHGHSGP